MTPRILLQADILEVDFGLAILEELTGEPLTHKNQKVRLFDQTTNTTETFYPSGKNGKPAIHNHATGEHWFPLKAYAEYHGLTWKESVEILSKQFVGEGVTADIARRVRQQQESSKNPEPEQPPSYHNSAEVARSIDPKNYEKNDFARYLRRLFGKGTADEVLQRFNVGTTHWHFRGTVFWQQDTEGEYRAGKIMAYTEPTGKRRKDDEYSVPRWAHEVQRINDFHQVQCLFGEHQLLMWPEKPVGVVESEKTAIILSVLLPKTVWLATGGSQNVGLIERCPALKDRVITLWPDLDHQFKCYDVWQKKAEQLRKKGFDVEVSQYLRNNSTVADRQNKMDLADFLAGPKDRCPETGRLLTLPKTPPPADVQSEPHTVTTIAEQLANPNAILKPDESQLDRLTVELCDSYPADWDSIPNFAQTDEPQDPESVSALAHLEAKNPALTDLITILDLELISNDRFVN